MSNYTTDPESWWSDLPEKCTCEPAWKDRGLIDSRCFWHQMIEVVTELQANGWTVAKLPPDTLVIVKEDGEWPAMPLGRIAQKLCRGPGEQPECFSLAIDVLDAAAQRGDE